MVAVAEQFRRALRERLLALSADERVELSGRLAASDLELYCAARQVPGDEARREIARLRQSGRRPSRVMREAAE
jgi:hypothetical protein